MPHFIFIQQISVLNILNMLYNLHFFPSKCRLFHNATFFGFCITHILNTGCAKIWKKKILRQKVNWAGRKEMCLWNSYHWPNDIKVPSFFLSGLVTLSCLALQSKSGPGRQRFEVPISRTIRHITHTDGMTPLSKGSAVAEAATYKTQNKSKRWTIMHSEGFETAIPIFKRL